jgi:hypothetical protein
MDTTSLITAMIGAQTGMAQLAVAASLARMNTDNSSSVTQLVDAAQQSSIRSPMSLPAQAPISTSLHRP